MPPSRPLPAYTLLGLVAPAMVHAAFLGSFSAPLGLSKPEEMPPTTAGWSYVGCVDENAGQTETSITFASAQNSPDECMRGCNARGFAVAALSYGDHCTCANALAASTAPAPKPEDECAAPCTGDGTVHCGGEHAAAVYRLDSAAVDRRDLHAEGRKSTSTKKPTSTVKPTSTKHISTKSTGKPTSTQPASTKSTGKPASTKSTPKPTSTKSTAKPTSIKTTAKHTITKTTAKPTSTKTTGKPTTTKPTTKTTKTKSTAKPTNTKSTARPTSTKTASTKKSTNTTKSTSTASTTSATATSTPAPFTGLVVAHHMVGNTYPYTQVDWAVDISLAQQFGIDAFALNVGRDDWQPDRVADAYAAAEDTGFYLFISLDMTSLPCQTEADADLIQQYIANYSLSDNQLMYNGNPLLSTFAGSDCTFGQGSFNDGWLFAIRGDDVPTTTFIPAFFVDPNTAPSITVQDGHFEWNSGWPQGDNDISWGPDDYVVQRLQGKPYMAAVSPWFFTHYGADSYDKNFIYRFDDWLLNERWELLVEHRDDAPIVEIVTWNDYGESSYVGPIEGAQPNSQAWVDGFSHTAWLDMQQYYIAGYKNGAYPQITQDRLFLWARLYPANATVDSDPVGSPANADWTEDSLWAVAFLTDAANVTLACGDDNTVTTSVGAGVTKLKLPLTETCSVTASVDRGDDNSISLAPDGFTFSTDPTSYNFNAFVASSGDLGDLWFDFGDSPPPKA